jgi:hypothetical protein
VPETIEKTKVVGAASSGGVKTCKTPHSKFNANDVAGSATSESKEGTENYNYISLNLYSSHNTRQH